MTGEKIVIGFHVPSEKMVQDGVFTKTQCEQRMMAKTMNDPSTKKNARGKQYFCYDI